MDKETLSNYGWIVICVMVLAVMLAFASPFGNFIAGAIKSTTQGLFDTNQNALDSAGIEIMQQEFEEMLNGPSATDSPVKFGQPYQMTMEENGMPLTVEYVFYPDGSATMWMADAMGGYLPAGTVTYTKTEVILEGDPIKISEDGTYLYDPEDETLRLTVKSVSKGNVKTNTAYTADPYGLVGLTGLTVQVGTDGSITVYQNGVAGETIPASAITWYENYFVFNDGGEETTGAIYPDGSKIAIGEIVCVDLNQPVVESKYKLGDVIEQGDYRYMYIGCQTYDEYKQGIYKYYVEYVLGASYQDAVQEYGSEDELKAYIDGMNLSSEAYYGYFRAAFRNGWHVRAIDKTKTSYGPITEQIDDVPVIDMLYAFKNCKAMVNAPVIPNGIISLDSTFVGCSSLKVAPTIPSNVIDMSSTFSSCSSLTDISNVVIPSGVTSLYHTFSYCTSLTDVSGFSVPANVTSLYQTFGYCSALTTVPDLSKATGLTDMWSTFTNCTSLTDLSNFVIPSSVTEMGGTFAECTSLTHAPDLTNCSKLIKMQQMFQNCTALRVAPNIPNSVTTMDNAFVNCTSLETAPVIPSSVTGTQHLFNGCTSLTGTVTINTYGSTNGFFKDVDFEAQNLTLAGSCSNLDAIGATGINYCAECNGKCQGNH